MDYSSAGKKMMPSSPTVAQASTGAELIALLVSDVHRSRAHRPPGLLTLGGGGDSRPRLRLTVAASHSGLTVFRGRRRAASRRGRARTRAERQKQCGSNTDTERKTVFSVSSHLPKQKKVLNY